MISFWYLIIVIQIYIIAIVEICHTSSTGKMESNSQNLIHMLDQIRFTDALGVDIFFEKHSYT